jgi:predicted short-subunit dehydrogenase-like oxidoreductase (DUF2520 family)
MKIAIAGAGNIATFFAKKFQAAGFEIVQVIAAHIKHAQQLAMQHNCSFSDQISDLDPGADVCLFAVKDDVLLEFAAKLRLQQIVIHTAGSVALSELQAISSRVACIWPVYSINKDHLPNEMNVPLVLNAGSAEVLSITRQLAFAISHQQYVLTDEQKSALHLAAVFANNFTNHLYTISEQITGANGVPFETLLPLILDTAQKVQHSLPRQNQTGPAIRHDEKTMTKHLNMLNDTDWQQIYRLISGSIQRPL